MTRACLFVMVGLIPGVAAAQTVSVPATINIYGSGHASAPATCTTLGAGDVPASIAVPGHRYWMEVTGATGEVFYCTACGPGNGPDGLVGDMTAGPLAGISGIVAHRYRFLEGVFLTSAEPVDPAPASLTFNDATFVQVAPGIAQQFFIGDGLTGVGSGAVQRFIVPQGATRLFLGFNDGFVDCIGAYGDNSGAFAGTVTFYCGADVGRQGGLPGHDGLLDNNDFVAFINAFFSGSAEADVGSQGGVRGPDGLFDNNDFISYINLFFEGC